MSQIVCKKRSKIQKKWLLVFLLFLILSLGTSFAFAQKELEVKYPKVPGAETPITTKTALPAYVKYIFNLSLMILGLIVFGAIIYGGFRYLTSAGSPEAIRDARDRILSAILGLFILLFSYLILTTINPQLIVLSLGRTEPEPINVAPPEPEEEEPRTFTFFQIPLGKIIERSILTSEAEILIDQTVDITKEFEKKSKDLKELAEDLKKETDKCKCGPRKCKAEGCYGPDEECDEPACIPQGCPDAKCNKEEIKKIAGEMEKLVTELENVQDQLFASTFSLKDRVLDFQKAAVLISLLYDEVEDYNTMLTDKYFMEKDGIKVGFDYFPGWEDIKVNLEGRTVNDPATFYFDKEGKEEIFADYIPQLTASDLPPPPPEPGKPLPPPPTIPGKLLWPLGKRITQSYGCVDCRWSFITFGKCVYSSCPGKSGDQNWGWHNGLDLGARDTDYQVRASADGIVFDSGHHTGYGNWVGVNHPQLGISTVYCHLREIKVSVGQEVKVGEVVGIADNTGYSSADHLHFMVYNGIPPISSSGSGKCPYGPNLNPLNYLE